MMQPEFKAQRASLTRTGFHDASNYPRRLKGIPRWTAAAIMLSILLIPLGTVASMPLGPNLAQAPQRKALYFANPVEHDEQGHGFEPDGQPGNCVADVKDDDRCELDAQLPGPVGRHIVPGCWDDAGRQPSGLCAMWSTGTGGNVVLPGANADVPGGGAIPLTPPLDFGFIGLAPDFMGIQGMNGAAAPGRLSPTKDTIVRMFDLRALQGARGLAAIDAQTPLEDSGAASLNRGALGSGAGGPVAAGDITLVAYFGDWKDLNGNGVIDEHGDSTGRIDGQNEFVWVGGACGGLVLSNGGCRHIPRPDVAVWLWTEGAAPEQPQLYLFDHSDDLDVADRGWFADRIDVSMIAGTIDGSAVLHVRAIAYEEGRKLFEDDDVYAVEFKA